MSVVLSLLVCAVYDFKFEVTRLYCVLLFMCGYFVCLFFCVIGVRIVVCFLIGKICSGFNEFITDMPLVDWAKAWCPFDLYEMIYFMCIHISL